MKSKKTALLALLSAIFFSFSQDKTVVELPLTPQNGYGPFRNASTGRSPYQEDDGVWKNTRLKISKFPEGLTDMKYGDIEANLFQSVYQNYLLGNITKKVYDKLQESWHWTPDTINLSKTPLKTKIAFAYGKDSEGVLKMVIDANNNLDLSDDELFTPLVERYWFNKDSIVLEKAIHVSLETFVHNKIVSVTVPLYITYDRPDRFMINFPQYMTTQYKGEQIAVSSRGFTDFSYNDIEVALIPEKLEKGEKLKDEYIYRKNEYIEIEDEILKILGVNTKKNALVLEKTNLPKTQLFSTQIGYYAHPFEGKDITTNSNISLKGLKGKYVLLDFWGEWCGPCIGEFPHLKKIYAKTDRKKFEIVGIASNSTLDGIKRLIDQHELTWIQIMSDDTNRIIETYGINSYPTTILVDAEGVIVAKDLRGDKLEEKILNLIKE